MMSAREFKRERCTDMTQTEAMEAYAAYVNKELVKVLEQVAALNYYRSDDPYDEHQRIAGDALAKNGSGQ